MAAREDSAFLSRKVGVVEFPEITVSVDCSSCFYVLLVPSKILEVLRTSRTEGPRRSIVGFRLALRCASPLACSVPLLFPRPCLAPLPGCRQPRPALLPPLPPPPLFPPQDLVPSFVSILKQITEHRLPRDFDYHRMPAPWIQMRLLRILALLGRADRATRWERKRGGSFAGDLGGAGRKLTPLCCIVMGSLSLPLIRSQGPAAGTRL